VNFLINKLNSLQYILEWFPQTVSADQPAELYLESHVSLVWELRREVYNTDIDQHKQLLEYLNEI